MIVFKPADAQQAADAIAEAAAKLTPLEIVAGGSKRRLGRPARPAVALDISALSGIIDYEPAELVLTARPATPLAVIEAEITARGQMLSFEPPYWTALLGSTGHATLGGVIACNLAGSRRVRAGSARDYLLGFHAVNGRGEPWKAGGKVVKNVTGYDLCKLQAGAFGTLSLLTEVTIKVMPRPETAATLVLTGLSDADAIATLAKALNTPFEVSGAAHLPARFAARLPGLDGMATAATLIRLEGPSPSVAVRVEAVEAMVGAGLRLGAEATAEVWAKIGAVSSLLRPDGCIWRLCPTPSAAADIAQKIVSQFSSAQVYYDWGGGLVWLSLDASKAGPDGGATLIRNSMQASGGGHATLIAAPDAILATVQIFEPAAGPLADLTQRIKAGFDPLGVLNPGRLHEGY